MPKIHVNHNLDESYLYCNHCDNLVSRSTYERHQKKRNFGSIHTERAQKAQRHAPSSTSDDEIVFSSDEGSSRQGKNQQKTRFIDYNPYFPHLLWIISGSIKFSMQTYTRLKLA